MSWAASLHDDRGHREGEWSFTHNCNGMANAVLDPQETREATIRWWTARGRTDVLDRIRADPTWTGSWFEMLDGLSGPDGAALLDRIVRGLEADPERFRAMNPANGWGDFDSFVKVLSDMRDAVPEWPTTWSVSG